MRTTKPIGMTDTALIKQFKVNPVKGYSTLLDQYTPVILRMIRRFLSDPDEVMETYTSILRAIAAQRLSGTSPFPSQ